VKAYIAQQMKFIHIYAKYLNVDDETAAWYWVARGLALKYSELYAESYL